MLGAFGGQGSAPQQPATRGTAYRQALSDFGQRQQFRATPSLGFGYGMTTNKKGEPGPYAGFKNESDLFNAIEGQAANLRSADVADIAGQRQGVESDLGSLEDRYQAQLDAALRDFQSRGAEARRGTGWTVNNGQVTWGAWPGESTAGPKGTGVPSQTTAVSLAGQGGSALRDARNRGGTAGVAAAQNYATALAPINQERKDYTGQINDWLAQQAGPLTEQLGALNETQLPSLSDYAQAAGAQYGVDPNITRGRFGEQQDVADYGTQRNLAAWQDYGMPFSEVTGLQREATGQIEAGQKAAQTAQETELVAQEQQISDAASAASGMDASQLASTTNLTVPQIYDAVTSSDFQQADADLQDAVSNQDQELFDQALRNIGIASPAAYEVLLRKYNQYAQNFDFFPTR